MGPIKKPCGDDVMMVRALICCAGLILGLLATLGATAQSAGVCNGPGCRPVEKSRPLDLMAFMRGGAQTSAKATAKTGTAKTGKHRQGTSRHGTSGPAARPAPDKAPPDKAPNVTPDTTPDFATLSPPSPLPTAAAAAYAAHAENDVQVVTGDQVNTIDLAMLRSSPETAGATPKTDTDASDRVTATAAEAGQVHDQVRDAASGPSDVAASAGKPATHSNDALRDDVRDDSWMGRIWSAVGDGFVALVAMVRQLFA
jgi:hypothetical protein